MIPRIVTDASITFFARGKPWTLSSDHPHFEEVRDRLLADETDEAAIIRLADVRFAVEDSTGGRASLTEEGLFLDGEALPKAWADKATVSPDSLGVLLVHPGDRVRVEGDEDAPDGIYVVGEVDDGDVDKRVYVESEDDFFGYVANESIKEVLKEDD